MKRVLIVTVAILASIYAVALAFPVDPDEQRPGTRLGGEVVDEEHPDWSFMTPQQLVYMQTSTWYFIPHSITTTTFLADNELYIPCGWCDTKTCQTTSRQILVSR